MRHTHAFSVAAVVALCVSTVTCRGNVVVDGGGTTAAGAAGTGGTIGTGTTCMSPAGGDCKTNADCGSGTCAPITPGGYFVCLNLPPEASSCSPPTNGGMNQCCTTADCKQGKYKCYSTTVYPYCGGPAKPIYNECATDQCTDVSDREEARKFGEGPRRPA